MFAELLRMGATRAGLLLRGRSGAAAEPTHPSAKPPSAAPDPFEALRVQIRLRAVAEEIRRLHTDTSIFARAARLEASAAAYDDLLGNACRMAGLGETSCQQTRVGYATPVPRRLAGRDLRARREFLLAERGWSW